VPTAHLSDRGVVRVSGEDARKFLDGLVTCDLEKLSPSAPRFGALLTPQGKLLFDFILFEAPQDAGGGFYLDCLKFMAPDLARRLGFYKLRAKVAVEDLSETLAVVAGWGDAAMPDEEIGLVGPDPRLPALGWRAIVSAEDASPPEGEAESREARPGEGGSATPGYRAYHVHRIALGVPEGGKDFLFNDTFPHEAMMDQLRGIDFDKGCYVGQEVVSRMQHRGTARTRILPVIYDDGFAAEPWSEVTAGARNLGKAGTGAHGRGLVMIRIDRAADALAAGETIRAGGLAVRLEKPDWAAFAFPEKIDSAAAPSP
jgi:tRNA-modifying protein YgfZ